MPIHMEGAVAPVAAWIANVSHRKAPGAISAMAFIVRPVRPSVAFISGAFSGISFPYLDVIRELKFTRERGVNKLWCFYVTESGVPILTAGARIRETKISYG